MNFQELQKDKNFNGQIKFDEVLSAHCTYKIGGPAKYFIEVNDEASLAYVLKLLKEQSIEWTILGAGSNILFSDKGFDGAIILLSGDFKELKIAEDESYVDAGCGVSFAKLVNLCCESGYSGFEFAAGIPGTLGGAVKMNAGLKTEWISKQIVSVRVVDEAGNIKNFSSDELDFGYRSSPFSDSEIVTCIRLKIDKAINDYAIQQINENVKSKIMVRKEKQPLNFPNCGSVFKNPQGKSAGLLIEEAELKGRKCGGAQISDKHANFIVNIDGASAKDVLSLIRLVQNKVYEKFKVKLFCEVKFIGFDEECSIF